MADINVTINPAPSVSATVSAAPEVDVTIGEGIPKHAVTHAPGGSDSLESYYATTGSLAYVSGLTSGAGDTGYLTGYVSKTETGNFYPSSNPSGFITGVDLSNYVTGQVVRPSETGDFITNSETGVFYPTSNPSGFITGVDLSSYATTAYVTGVSGSLQTQITNLNNSTGAYVTGSVVRPSETGSFITSSQTGAFYPESNPSGFITGVDLSGYVTGDVVRPSETGDFITSSETGNFYPINNPSGFITGVDLSSYVTGDVVRPSETGNFITNSQTGAFYSSSNPSGFITGVDLSSYATTVYVTGVSGHLQNQISNLNNATGSYVTGSVVRPSETGNFVTTSQTGAFAAAAGTGAFLTTGAADGRYALQSATGNFVTTSQTGDFYPSSNPSGYITGVDLSAYVTGSVVRPSETGAFLTTGAADVRYVGLTGDQTISGVKAFISRPTVNGTGVLLSGEGGAATNTGELTGVFYPLNSNPSGYITGVDLSSYATQSLVTGVSGYLQGQVNTLNGQTGNYVTGSVVRPSETGNFVTVSQTGQFVSTGSTGNFVTGSVVRPSETGNFITSSQTGAFYPTSNPSGYITGVDLSAYVTGAVVRPSETGAFLTTGAADGRYALQSATGDFITTAQTGVFYPISNPSGFITGVDLSSYATQSFVTGVSGDLQTKLNIVSGYAVTGYDDSITGISVTGNSIKTITLFQRDGGNLSASFTDASGALLENVVYTTGNQRISGIKTFANSGVFESDVSFSGKLIFDTSHTGEVLDGEVSWDSEYGALQIGMNSGDVINPIGFKSFFRVKANQNIGKGKVVMAVGAVGNSEFILAQEAANIGSSGELIMGVAAEAITAGNFGDVVAFGAVKGVDTSSFTSGSILYFDAASTGGFTQVAPEAPNAKVITAFNINTSANGTVFVRVSAGSVLGGTDSNVKFTTLQDNNFIAYNAASGIWYNKTLTTGDVSGISNYALKSETGAFLTTGAADGRYALQSATGNFITTAQTGQFYPTSNPSGYITGVDLSSYVTGAVVRPSETGAFLTTGAADNRYALQSATGNFITAAQTGQFVSTSSTGAFLTTGAADARYYSLANGQSISGYAITGYNDAVTGISVTGSTTKTITLFQRDGTTVTGAFTDDGGSVSNVVYITGAQTISGDKTFANKLIAATGFFGVSNSFGDFSNQTIAGGNNNIASGDSASVLGGSSNQAIDYASTVVGGVSNLSSGNYSFVGGGDGNNVKNSYSSIVGGRSNTVEGERAFVGGGFGNKASGGYSSTVGGFFNTATGQNSFVGGGYNNQATGISSTVVGGDSNIAGGSYSTAMGYGAKADRYGSKAHSSDYFIDAGDAQNISFVLNGKSINGSVVVLSMDGNALNFNLLEGQTNKVVLATIKVIGVDENANISQCMRKIVFSSLSSNTGQQRIHHLESIGTDLETAGAVFFSATGSLNTGSYQNVFCIFGSGLAAQATHWVAHVDAVETILPAAYP